MRVLAMVLACGLAGSAGAACLAPGQLPTRVTFANGDVMDTIVRAGNHLKSVTHLDGGLTATHDEIWGLYPAEGGLDGYFEQFRWQHKDLPEPATLEIGKEVKLRARREAPGGSTPFVMLVTAVGREEIAVGKCRYDVLHLRSREGKPSHINTVSDYWLDTDRLMVWARETSIYDSADKLEHVVHIRAVAAQ